MNKQAQPTWMDDPSVQNISPEKIIFLQQMYDLIKGKTKKELMSTIPFVIKQAKENHLTLTPGEMNAAMAAIRKHSTKEELEQMESLINNAKKQAAPAIKKDM